MDLITSLRRDHAEFGAALTELEQLIAALDSRFFRDESAGLHAALETSVLLSRLLPKLERHERTERRFLFPELAKWSSEFGPILKRLEAEHEEADRELGRLLDLLPDLARKSGGEFQRELEHMISRFRKHIFVEEIEIFPIAEDAIPRERLEQLWTRAEAERIGADDPLKSGAA